QGQGVEGREGLWCHWHPMVDFRLLGVFEVVSAGRAVDLGPPKQRTLLAALAVDAGRPVPVDALVDRLWDDEPPLDARKVLHTYVARVRRVLERLPPADGGRPAVGRTAGGYQLAADAELVDLHRFRRLM